MDARNKVGSKTASFDRSPVNKRPQWARSNYPQDSLMLINLRPFVARVSQSKKSASDTNTKRRIDEAGQRHFKKGERHLRFFRLLAYVQSYAARLERWVNRTRRHLCKNHMRREYSARFSSLAGIFWNRGAFTCLS